MTETLTEQPTIEALRSRITATKLFPETIVNLQPHTRTEGVIIPVLVTATRTPDAGPEEHVHTIQALEPAPSGNGWLHRRGVGDFLRYEVAEVNPEPVNGHHYRSLGSDQYLVRYNDDDHIGDRHVAACPWSLIRGAGTTPWVVPADGLHGMTLHPYVEVEYDEAAPAVPEAEETAVRTAETEEPAEEEPATIGNEESGPTRGMGFVEENGTVLLDPDMVPGEMYLLWADERYDPAYSDTYLVTYLGGDATAPASFLAYGYFDWSRGRDMVRWTSDYYSAYTTNRMHWAKAALVKPEPDDAASEGAVTTMTTTLEEEREAFTEFNERANRIAKDAGWCSEYDRIVTSVGMKGRFKRYSFDVSVTFTFDDDNPSSATDVRVRELHGLDNSLSLTSIEYSATMDVTVIVEDQPSREDAENWIDSSVLEDRISETTTGLRNIDVSDYSIDDWENLDGDDEDDD